MAIAVLSERGFEVRCEGEYAMGQRRARGRGGGGGGEGLEYSVGVGGRCSCALVDDLNVMLSECVFCLFSLLLFAAC